MNSTGVEVFVVDDDPRVRRALRWLIESVGLPVAEYPSGEQFLQAYSPTRRGCLVLDVRMHGMSGLQVLEQLKRQQRLLPTIVLTGHGDVRMAVRAMKLGVLDFIEKPYADQEFLDLVQRACQEERRLYEERQRRLAVEKRLDALTQREWQVLERVVAGDANKVIALTLGISEKTVEAHRKSIMLKTEAKSFAELVTITLQQRRNRENP